MSLRFALKRFLEEARSSFHPDFDDYFLPAGRALLRGQSPWSVRGYVHPPLNALVAGLSDLLPGNPYTGYLAVQVMAGLAACALIVWPLSARLQIWQQALVFVGANQTLWSSRPTIRLLFLGQNDLLLLFAVVLCAALASRGRSGLAALALTLGAWIKLWPALNLVWVAHRRLPHRRRAIVAGAGSLVAIAFCPLLLGGPSAAMQWFRGVLGVANQGLTSYSALGAGEALFSTSSPFVISITESPALVLLTTGVLTALALALIAICLTWVADPVACLFAVTSLCLVLLSVSQYPYQVLVLPLAWYWAAHVLTEPRAVRYWVVLAAAGLWWVTMCFWVPPAVSLDLTNPVISSEAFLIQFVSFVGFLAVSVAVAVLDTHPDQFRPRPMPWGSRSAPQPSSTSAWSNANRSVMPPT
ncbi:glycosyltransferase family 87 protein [Aestuariimicrobium soli]|uniref:glycosyltransferase family 87 protein n=1 Tax=Aestuariimicrobium soli TaxID=2035834 RepID=UPI003EBB3ACA